MPQGPGQYPRPDGSTPPHTPRKRSRGTGLAVGAVALALLSGGIGGGVAMLVHPDHSTGISATGAAPSVPAASVPAGSVEQVALKVVPSVVKLEVDRGRASEEGSGVILSTDGLILTNNHVVAAAQAASSGAETKVTFADGSSAPFTVVGTDPGSDIAVVRAENVSGLTPITVGSSAELKVGQDVVAIGSPFGLGQTATTGIVSARGRDIGAGPYDDFLQIDAPINKGNSGGPTFNVRGEVIGVNTAIISPTGVSAGIGFAVPSNMAKSVIAQLKEKGAVSRGWLGVNIQQVTKDLAAGLGLEKPGRTRHARAPRHGVEGVPRRTRAAVFKFDKRGQARAVAARGGAGGRRAKVGARRTIAVLELGLKRRRGAHFARVERRVEAKPGAAHAGVRGV